MVKYYSAICCKNTLHSYNLGEQSIIHFHFISMLFQSFGIGNIFDFVGHNLSYDFTLNNSKLVTATTHTNIMVLGRRTREGTNMVTWAIWTYCHCIPATAWKKKGRQTCWSFLLILLTLVAVVELRKGIFCLLQPRHKDLYVIQGTVEDLLRETNPEIKYD